MLRKIAFAALVGLATGAAGMMTSQAFPIASPLPKVGNTADVLQLAKCNGKHCGHEIRHFQLAACLRRALAGLDRELSNGGPSRRVDRNDDVVAVVACGLDVHVGATEMRSFGSDELSDVSLDVVVGTRTRDRR